MENLQVYNLILIPETISVMILLSLKTMGSMQIPQGKKNRRSLDPGYVIIDYAFPILARLELVVEVTQLHLIILVKVILQNLI